MHRSIKYTLPPLLITLFTISSTFAASPTDFIRSSCGTTTYPTICIHSLSAYTTFIRHNPRQLAHAALTISANRARETSSYITHLTSPTAPTSVKSRAFQDCVRMMVNSANKLAQSVKELSKLGRTGSPSFALCMSNVQTWVSGALTEQNMCLSSLKQGGVAAAGIRKKVVEVIQVTTNALTLVNKING